MEDSRSSASSSKKTVTSVYVGLCVAVALFVALDPFKLSIIGNDPSFTAKRVRQPSLSQAAFPRDARSRLQSATKKFVGGSMGPESLAVDAGGNGPYTGVADGRILKWANGEWQEFAHTSPNRNFFLLVLSGDDSGRLLKYDPRTKEVNVVLQGLQFPNGVALSKDESFLVVAESVPGRLLKHWLKGPQLGETEVMALLPGYPDNVRVNEQGDFWVAMHSRRNLATMISGALPWLRRAFLQLPIPFKHIYRLFNGGPPHGIIAKYNSNGDVLDVLEDLSGSVVKYTSEVDEHHGQLWIGSVLLPYIAIYDFQTN